MFSVLKLKIILANIQKHKRGLVFSLHTNSEQDIGIKVKFAENFSSERLLLEHQLEFSITKVPMLSKLLYFDKLSFSHEKTTQLARSILLWSYICNVTCLTSGLQKAR